MVDSWFDRGGTTSPEGNVQLRTYSVGIPIQSAGSPTNPSRVIYPASQVYRIIGMYICNRTTTEAPTIGMCLYGHTTSYSNYVIVFNGLQIARGNTYNLATKDAPIMIVNPQARESIAPMHPLSRNSSGSGYAPNNINYGDSWMTRRIGFWSNNSTYSTNLDLNITYEGWSFPS